MSAVGRLRPAGLREQSDQNDLDAFQSERVAPRASAKPRLFESVAAYPDRESHPTSSARLSPASPVHVSGAAVGPRVMTAIGQKVRWIALAPVRLCVAGVAAIGRAVMALARAVVRAIVGAVVGTIRSFVAGLQAVWRGVAAACAFVVQTFVDAVRAGFALLGRAVTRASLTVAAFARAVVRGIVGAGVGTVRLFVAGLQAVWRGVAAARAFVVQTFVRAMTASLAIVTAGFATLGRAATQGSLAVAARARTVVRWLTGAAVGTARRFVTGIQAVGRVAAVAFTFVLDGTGRAVRANAALGVSATAVGRRATVSGARTLTAAATASARLMGREVGRVRHTAARVAMKAVSLVGAALSSATSTGLAWWNRGARVRRPRELWAAAGAAALVVAVVTAGGVLQLSRGPVAEPVAAVARVDAPAEPQPVVTPAAAAVTPRADAGARPMTPRATRTAKPAPPATRRPPARADVSVAPSPRAGLKAETVRAIWRKTDTRSLDRGIAAVRTATLALHRCTVQMTASDRAVARCDVRPAATDGSAPPRNAAWTIDFRRADERWLIDDISAAAP